MTVAYEVRLTIPDNTAFTALSALRRLGIPCDEVERADVYVIEVEDALENALEARLRTVETVFNPNKHALTRRDARPAQGELWIADIEPEGAASSRGKERSMTTVRLAGRTLEGVRSLSRQTVWRLRQQGAALSAAQLGAAADALLCNAAYQRGQIGA